ncbi:MAG: tetratricopeptide repeat protein [Nannocystaceae bacterium]|nr:tetratricopeptide repeat protein [Nannocystaceae bacterium]
MSLSEPGSARPSLQPRRSRGRRDRPQTPRRAGVGAAGLVWLSLGLLSANAALGCATRGPGEAKAPAEGGVAAADKHYDVAVGSFHNSMFEDAKLQLSRALTSDPGHADSHYLLGVLLLNEGRTIVDAVEIDRCLVDEAAGHQRQRAEALHRKAREQFKTAAKHYESGAAGRGRSHNSMSVVDLFFGADGSAITEARAALAEQFYTHRYSALANLGWAYHSQGNLVEATTELRQSVMINPDYCVGRYRLAQVYLDSERPDLALEHASTVADDSRCPIQDAHRIVGVANLRLGRADEAHTAFEQCVALSPRSCLAVDCSRFLGPSSTTPDLPAVSPPTLARTAVNAHPATDG